MAEKEVSLSIEETNRLRASLGLKPLAAEAPQQPKQPEPKKDEDAKPDADTLRAKLAEAREAREKRRREAELRATRTLGEAGEDVDDVANWISKIQPGAKQQQQQQQQQQPDGGGPPAKRQRRAAAAAAGGSDEPGGDDGAGGHTAADLAGVAVRHDVGELAEGETVVLTLADQGILDEKGELADGPDELIEVLSAQEKARRKARAAATKTAKPLWEEDGKVRGLLDKYDEEEEEAVAAFDAAGALQAQERRQAELRAKLAGGTALLDSADVRGQPGQAAAGDYQTEAEAAAGKGEKQRKKKKRKLRTTKAGGDEADGALDLDALEAAAAAQGTSDLGSRQAREARQARAEVDRAAAAAERAARFEAALARANEASEALRQRPGGAGALDPDEADNELAASLARARRLASKSAGGSSGGAAANGSGGSGAGGGGSLEAIARQLAVKREEDEARLQQQLAAGGGDAFTETTEFVRSIQVAVKPEDGAAYMDVDEAPPPPPPPPPGGPGAAAAAAAADGAADAGAGEAAVQQEAAALPPPPDQAPQAAAKQARKYRKGGWVSAEGGDDMDEDGQQQRQQNGGGGRALAPELQDTGVVGERAMGKGLAACLGLIKDKGLLRDKVQWSGRTNDKKPVALIGLEDVYTGGSHEDAMAQRIETALTQRDEFGRIMTPKERFRVMCHQFHGMAPSKNKQEERQRKYLEEVAMAKATSSDNPSAQLDQLKELQQKTGSAYIPLTGRIKRPSPLDRDGDAPSGLASARTPAAATPMLGGGMTPLAGNRKVEMMLGIAKPPPGAGGASMLPPAPRK